MNDPQRHNIRLDASHNKIHCEFDVGFGAVICAAILAVGLICFGSVQCSPISGVTEAKEASP